MIGTGISTTSASRQSSTSRTAEAPTRRSKSTVVRMTPCVTNCSSALTSFVTRDINSPVEVRSKNESDRRCK